MGKTSGGKRLYASLLKITLLPILLLTLVITSFSIKSFMTVMSSEVKVSLQDVSASIMTMYDMLYPGDYEAVMQGGEIYFLKGDHQINGDFELIDAIKEQTDMDVSILYQDVRVVTTITGDDGNRMIGTKVNAVVANDVLLTGESAFYESVRIGSENYFAYYAPLLNSDGTCMGMLFVAKPVSMVRNSTMQAVLPIVGIGFLALIFAMIVTIHYAGGLNRSITGIETFLSKVAKGDLNEPLPYDIKKRGDEIGELGRHALLMQKSLRDLVEKDMLTGLYNRRCGERRLHKVQNDAVMSGCTFCVAIGDLDLFKSINDTYGHEAGDAVLERCAAIMADEMRVCGFACRWGGEEFLLVFEDTALEDADQKLTRMLARIRRTPIVTPREVIHVTMTVGVCEGGDELLDQTLRRADDLLYKGKEGGRDQVVSG